MSVSVASSDTRPIDFFFSNHEQREVQQIKILPLQEKIPSQVSYANLYFDEFSRPTSRQNLLALLAQPTPDDITPEQARRDPKRGAWTFQPHTEDDLLTHVENGLAEHIEPFNEIDSAEAILRSIDVYCLGKQWMFHVGQEKGEILKGFLKDCLETTYKPSGDGTPFVVVDLGTYCGYSSILLAKTIREHYPDLHFHLYSLERSAKFTKIAQRMIQLAKLDKYISILHNDPKSLSATLSEHLPARHSQKIDYLFLDHDKSSYLTDLKEMEGGRFLQKGSYVAADNVIISPFLRPYRDYMAKLAKHSIVSTTMVEQKLEYSDSRQNLHDGIELTKYL